MSSLLHLQAVLSRPIMTVDVTITRGAAISHQVKSHRCVSAESERMMEHDGRDTVSQITRVSQSVLVKVHYHPLRLCAAAAAAIIHLPLR